MFKDREGNPVIKWRGFPYLKLYWVCLTAYLAFISRKHEHWLDKRNYFVYYLIKIDQSRLSLGFHQTGYILIDLNRLEWTFTDGMA